LTDVLLLCDGPVCQREALVTGRRAAWQARSGGDRDGDPFCGPIAGRAAWYVAIDHPGRACRAPATSPGPEVFRLDELSKITLAARGDHRTVVTDDSAGMFAAASGDALIAKTAYRDWLAR
jgi:hypothetical protein